jgi:hypothetical protein
MMVRERRNLKGIYSLKHEVKVSKLPHKKEAVIIQGASVLSSRFSVSLKDVES